MSTPLTNTKPAVQSKQIWGTIVLVLSTVLGAWGIAADPSFASDGIQFTGDFEQILTFIGIVGGALLRDYGQRSATERVDGVVSQQPKK